MFVTIIVSEIFFQQIQTKLLPVAKKWIVSVPWSCRRESKEARGDSAIALLESDKMNMLCVHPDGLHKRASEASVFGPEMDS